MKFVPTMKLVMNDVSITTLQVLLPGLGRSRAMTNNDQSSVRAFYDCATNEVDILVPVIELSRKTKNHYLQMFSYENNLSKLRGRRYLGNLAGEYLCSGAFHT